MIVYVAGPYRARNKWFKQLQVIRNIWRAREVAKMLWHQGHTALCPHSNSGLFSGDVAPDHVFIDGYLELLELCDAMVLLPGWQQSDGVWQELSHARKHGIAVYTLENWMKRGTVPDEQLRVSLRQGRAFESLKSNMIAGG